MSLTSSEGVPVTVRSIEREDVDRTWTTYERLMVLTLT